MSIAARWRSLCGFAGTTLAITGLALVPLYARSAGQNRTQSPFADIQQRAPTPARRDRTLPSILDPFDRPIVEFGVHPGLSHQVPRPPTAHASGLRPATVRAIVTGGEPRALVESASGTIVVGIGDRVGTARVRAITDDAITLEDGARLELEAAP